MGWVVSVAPWPLYRLGKTRYPLYRRLGRPQGWSGRVRQISPPPGFDYRTVHPVASRYTDRAIPADRMNRSLENFQQTLPEIEPGLLPRLVA
jgi:hypothetical protein